MKEPVDVSLDYVKVYYRSTCGKLNPYFDKEIKEVCKKYGLHFWASGMDMEIGERDLNFRRK